MRIVSGSLGGRILAAPKSFRTHPMSEKMRGALFNVLSDISGLTVFDAYGGSGALACEAISRGADSVKVCEIDKHAVKVIENNVKVLGISQAVKLIKQNSAVWVENNPKIKFDLVICDPPYNDIKQAQLETISQSVKPNGLFIISLPPANQRYIFNGFIIEADKSYGDGSLVFYRRQM
jgi:16S rRNA (guanine966-N2)-methyltransferase